MDTATSDIRAVEFTPISDGENHVLPELLDQIPEGEVIGMLPVSKDTTLNAADQAKGKRSAAQTSSAPC